MKSLPCLLLLFLSITQSTFSQFRFTSPLPGSPFHNPDCRIILREGSSIDPASVTENDLFTVEGLKSGEHEIKAFVSDDRKTIIISPLHPFTEGEKVMVSVKDGIRKRNGEIISGCSFSFQIRPPRTPLQNLHLEAAKRRIYEEEFGLTSDTLNYPREGDGLPELSIDVNTDPAPGNLFYYNSIFYPINDDGSYICIMSSEGDSVYSLKTTHRGSTFDINHNGYLTLFNYDSSYFEMWDSSYNIIDIYKTGNGYTTDPHEFQIFPDGHSFMLSYDAQIVDMTVYNANYQPEATVIGTIIQELDSGKNVIFEWRSWDHVGIMEALHTDFAAAIIDYVHANAIELDTDGNLLVSCRVLDQVLKIDRNSGDIIWRLGGLNNEFIFINDEIGFNRIHDIRRLPNGHITLFDNGSYHVPPQTFIKEYELDEVNKTATQVWSYTYPVNGNPLVSWAMGNAQRLENGHTLINWGSPSYNGPAPNITEVDSAGTIVWEMHFTDSLQYMIYRAHRHEWDPCARPTGNLMYTTDVASTSAVIHWPPATGALEYLILFRPEGNGSWDSLIISGSVTSYPLLNLLPFTFYEWSIQTICNETGKSSGYSAVQSFSTLPTSLDPVKQEMFISVYPNPSDDLLYIHMRMDQSANSGIQMFNMLGQSVYQEQLSLTEEEMIFAIPVQDLPGGMYLLQVSADDDHQLHKILIE